MSFTIATIRGVRVAIPDRLVYQTIRNDILIQTGDNLACIKSQLPPYKAKAVTVKVTPTRNVPGIERALVPLTQERN